MSLMRKQTEIGSAAKIVWVIKHLCEASGGSSGIGSGGVVVQKWRKLCEAGGGGGGRGGGGGVVAVDKKWRKLCEAGGGGSGGRVSGDGGVKKWGNFYWCRE